MIKIVKDGRELNQQEMRKWIGKAVNSHLINKMHRAGYSAEEIASTGGLPINIVEKKIAAIEKAKPEVQGETCSDDLEVGFVKFASE